MAVIQIHFYLSVEDIEFIESQIDIYGSLNDWCKETVLRRMSVLQTIEREDNGREAE